MPKMVVRAIGLLFTITRLTASAVHADVPAPRGAEGSVPAGLRALGVVSRPPNSVQIPCLDVAWAAYTTAVDEAAKAVWAAAEREAAAADGAIVKAYWQEVFAIRERTGRWPAHEACVAVVGTSRKRCAEAFDDIVLAYQNAANDLTKQKQFDEARGVRDELAKLRDTAKGSHGRFDAAAFGFQHRAVLGHGAVFGSWEPDPARVFAKEGVPLLNADGVLVRSLRGGLTTRDGLRVKDVVTSVAGRLIRGPDDWKQALDGLELGRPVVVQILRFQGAWKPRDLVVLPVDDAGLQILEITRDKDLLEKCPLKEGENERQRILRDAIAKVVNEPVEEIQRAFQMDDGPFIVLVVAVARKDDDAIVEALQALGPKRLQLMNELTKRTDWGRLPAPLERGLNNAKVLMEAWKAVVREWSLDTGGGPRR